MGITSKQLQPYFDTALDGMLACVKELGDDRINRKPDLRGANSPYVILFHCIQLTHWWVGTMCAGREMIRDRDGEFVASGTVADLVEAMSALKAELSEDLVDMDLDAPMYAPHLLPATSSARSWNRAQALIHAYEELAQHHGHMEITRDILLAG